MKAIEHAGYIFNFSGYGAFDPEGKIDGQLSQDEIETHNRQLAAQEMALLRETGKGMLYLFTQQENGRSVLASVGTWASAGHERIKIARYRKSLNNWGAQRIDVWFYLDGKTWHGVNVGDNDIVRVKRNKI